jgi:hypothetical protein
VEERLKFFFSFYFLQENDTAVCQRGAIYHYKSIKERVGWGERKKAFFPNFPGRKEGGYGGDNKMILIAFL